MTKSLDTVWEVVGAEIRRRSWRGRINRRFLDAVAVLIVSVFWVVAGIIGMTVAVAAAFVGAVVFASLTVLKWAHKRLGMNWQRFNNN